MDDQPQATKSSLSLNDIDVDESAACAAAMPSAPSSGALSMLIHGRRVQQRYELLTSGSVQVCRVPHAKNIIEKIRFSRFLRRWEDHDITLAHNEISSETVGIAHVSG